MTTRQPQDKDGFAAEPRAIDLREYWLVVRRRWVLVVVTALLGAALGAGYALHSGRKYSATAQVLVAPVTQGPLNLPSQVNLEVNMSTEQAVAQSGPVIDQAAKLMRIQPAVLQADASKHLSVAVPTTSDVLQITWQAKTAKAAQSSANAFADAYLSYRHAYLAAQIVSLQSVLRKQVSSLQTQIARATDQLSRILPGSPGHQSLAITVNQLTSQLSDANTELASLPTYNDSGGQVIPSSLPLSPSGLGHVAILIMGGLLGLIVGLVIAFTRDVFDDRVREAAQFERNLGAVTLGVLPPAGPRLGARGDGWDSARQRQQGRPLTIVSQPDSRAAETVRWLRARLLAVAATRNMRTVLVVGADASVSSGRIAAELGVALAESGRSVLLMAADVRGSVLPQIFDLPNTSGLSDLLDDGGDPEMLTTHPKQATGIALPRGICERLAVLPGGSATGHERSVLDSGAMAALLKGRREAYEFVLLDCPPVSDSADILALAAQVDGVVVIGREGRTKGRALGDVRRLLDQAGAHLLGGVFIGSGRTGRHRHRSARPRLPASESVARTERRGSGPVVKQPPPVTQPLPVTPDDPAIQSSDRGGLAKRSM